MLVFKVQKRDTESPRIRSWGFLPQDSLLFMTQAGPVFLFVRDDAFDVCSIEGHSINNCFLTPSRGHFCFLWNGLDLLN